MWNLSHVWWKYFDIISLFGFINSFTCCYVSYSQRNRIAAQLFSYFFSNFWQNIYFFLSQEILKAICMIVGKSYERFLLKKIFGKVLTGDLSSNVFFCFLNLLILLGWLLFTTSLGGYWLWNKTCKKRSDYYLLTNKNGSLLYRQYLFLFLFWKIWKSKE